MRIDPPKPKKVAVDVVPEPGANDKYKQIAAIVLVFLGVFYFFFKVIF